MISSVHLTTCNQSTSKKYSLTEIRGAREASLIQKGRTIDPDCLNIGEETYCFISLCKLYVLKEIWLAIYPRQESERNETALELVGMLKGLERE